MMRLASLLGRRWDHQGRGPGVWCGLQRILMEPRVILLVHVAENQRRQRRGYRCRGHWARTLGGCGYRLSKSLALSSVFLYVRECHSRSRPEAGTGIREIGAKTVAPDKEFLVLPLSHSCSEAEHTASVLSEIPLRPTTEKETPHSIVFSASVCHPRRPRSRIVHEILIRHTIRTSLSVYFSL
jgi:hypothetical protein